MTKPQLQYNSAKSDWSKWALDKLESLFYFKKEIIDALRYAPNTHSFDDVAQMVLSGRALMWEVKPPSFLITELVNYPQTRVCHIFLAGGDLDALINLHPTIIAYAKATECSALTLTGRQGWCRVLEQQGWERGSTSVLLRFDGREERYGRQGWRHGNGHADSEDGTAEVDRGRSQDEPSDSERSGGDPISA